MGISFLCPEPAGTRRNIHSRATGCEGLIYVNGRAAGTVGWAAESAVLTRKARPGETFEVYIEHYAGHGPRRCDGGPIPLNRPSLAPVTGPQQTVTISRLRAFEEDALQLLVDVNTLWDLRQALPPESLRQAEIDQGLRDFTTIVDFELPRDRMDAAWKKVLLNQFHDVLPGSSIRRVYEEAEALYGEVLDVASAEARRATGAIVRKGADVSVFNSLNWGRSALVEVPRGVPRAGMAVQKVGGRTLAEVTVPSCGWTSLTSGAVRTADVAKPVVAEPGRLENEFLRVTLNAKGEITGILDKETGREITAGVCNRMLLFKDVPSQYDAWDIDSNYRLMPVRVEGSATVEATASGPLMGRVTVRKPLGSSTLTQEIVLRRGSRRIDFVTKIDWRERHRMLKVAFPVNVHSHEAVHEIQFGHLRRPNHESRPFDQDRFEVSHHKWSALVEEGRGCAVLNDCKYGSNVVGNTIQLTLLRSPLAPDQVADQGLQEFTYSLYAWNGSLMDSNVVREAYDLNAPVLTVPGRVDTASMFSVDAANIVIEAVKPAEDGTGDVVVRLYETKRTATACTLRTALPVKSVQETDMLENPKRKLASGKGTVKLEFRPFEIKTVRMSNIRR